MSARKVYRLTNRCEVTFSLLNGDLPHGSVSLLLNGKGGARRIVYFYAQGCYFAIHPEHTGEDRLIFEQALLEAAQQYWKDQFGNDQNIKATRVNYPAAVRRRMAPYPAVSNTQAGVC